MSDEEKYRALGCSEPYSKWMAENHPIPVVENVVADKKLSLRQEVIKFIKWRVLSWLQRKNS